MVGDKIWLKENREEGWKREEAEILKYSPKHDTYIVQVKPESDEDDGVREVTSDQIESN